MPVSVDTTEGRSLEELGDDAERQAGRELIRALECFQRSLDPSQSAFSEPAMLHLLACWRFATVAVACRAALAKKAETPGANLEAARLM
jgi:hypothetical protein